MGLKIITLIMLLTSIAYADGFSNGILSNAIIKDTSNNMLDINTDGSINSVITSGNVNSILTSGSGYGTQVEVTYMDQLKVALPNLLVGDAFNSTVVEPNYWSMTGVNSSTVTTTAGAICLIASNTANGSCSVQSVSVADYYPGQELVFRGIFYKDNPSGTTNNVQRWGAFDANNGVFFISSGTSFGIGYRKGGVDTFVSSSSWNKNNTVWTPTANLRTYEIYWTNSKIRYVISGVGMVHEELATTSQLVNTTNLPIRFENNNWGGSTSTSTLCSAVASITRNGSDNRITRSKTLTTAGTYVLKYGSSRLIGVWLGTLTAGTVSIYNATSASGTPIVMTVAANTITSQYLPLNDISFESGITVVLSANNNVTIFYK